MTELARRVGSLYQLFDQQFHRGGRTRIVQAPGRVNLIGDHVDYNLLPVLPMAIDRSTLAVIRERDDDQVRIVNADEQFPPRSFTITPAIEPGATGDWSNYVKAAVQTLLDDGHDVRGFDAAFSSNVPIASGLSSSSSLVVAAALALLASAELEVEAHHLMGRLAAGERFVGTQGGGMDQAVVLGGRDGHAVRIAFNPLSLTPVAVPERWRFIVASSMVAAEKSGDAQVTYNQRVSECETARQHVAQYLELDDDIPYAALLASRADAELVEAGAYALDDILRARFRHVMTEAGRVDLAVAAMHDKDLADFGRLMTESHNSLRDDCEVSCPELNELVDIALDAGASGARMTGAGFGGCTVALCHESHLDDVMASLESEFFRRRGVTGPLDDVLFCAQPSPGAAALEA